MAEAPTKQPEKKSQGRDPIVGRKDQRTFLKLERELEKGDIFHDPYIERNELVTSRFSAQGREYVSTLFRGKGEMIISRCYHLMREEQGKFLRTLLTPLSIAVGERDYQGADRELREAGL